LLQENVRTFPEWITAYYTPDNRQITRTTGVHVFDANIRKWLGELPNGGGDDMGGLQIAFDYALPVDDGRCRVDHL